MKLYSIDDFRIDNFRLDRYRLDNYRLDGAGGGGIPLSTLNVGDKVKFGTYQVASETPQAIIWKVAAKNHIGYPANSVTLITEKIIDLRAADAKEPSNSDADRKLYGNSRYSASNIDQWLNKDSAAGGWYSAAHVADAQPDTSASVGGYATQYSDKTGFLNLFTAGEKALLLNATIRVAKPTIDGGGYEDIARKIFLPSTTEVGLPNEGGTAEGVKFALFSDNASRISYLTQQAFSNTPSSSKPGAVGIAWYWWLRTPYDLRSYCLRSVNVDGIAGSPNAFNGSYGLRAVCNLSDTTLISATVDEDGCYTLV